MTTMATHWRRRTSALGNPFNRPEFLFDLTACLITLLLVVAVMKAPVSGDYGQWLMVSRFYSGDDVPDYRNIEGVAPLVPFLLALIRIPIPDPFDSVNALRVLLVIALPMSCYIAAASLFRSRAAGLMTLVLAAVGTGSFMELFAFGGLLQIASLAFMILSLGVMGRITYTSDNEGLMWTLASVAASLAVLSHAGSVVIVVPVTAGAGALVLVGVRNRRSPRDWAILLAPPVVIGLAAVAYWFVVLVPTNEGYSTNPASWSYRGPDRVYDSLQASPARLAILIFGAASIVQGLAMELVRRRLGANVIVAWWALATWGLFFAMASVSLSTDYPRFLAPLLAPLIVGAGAGLARLVAWLQAVFLPTAPRPPTQARGGILAAIVLLVLLGPTQLESFQHRASGYRIEEQSSMAAIADWVDTSLPEGQSVLVLDARDGKWLEGLTGEPSVFTNNVRFNYREHEWQRSIAADALVRSTSGLSNGLIEGKYINSATGPNGAVPRDLVVTTNHDGEYVDFLQLSHARSRIMTGDGSDTLATLGALRPQSVERTESADGVTIKTVWAGMRRGVDVTWTRTVSLARDSLVLDIVDEISTPAPVRAIELELRSFSGLQMTTLVYGDGSGLLLLPKMGSRQPRMDLQVLEGEPQLAQAGTDLLVRAEGTTRMHIQLKAHTAGAAISQLELLYPPDLLDDYNIGAAVLKTGPAYEARLARLRAIGFRPEMEVGGYMLLVRDEMKSWQLPLWASDGDAQDGREDATSDQRIGGLR